MVSKFADWSLPSFINCVAQRRECLPVFTLDGGLVRLGNPPATRVFCLQHVCESLLAIAIGDGVLVVVGAA